MLALILACSAGARAQDAMPRGSLMVETIPYPDGVGSVGSDVSYSAPPFRALRQGIVHADRARTYYLYAPEGIGRAPRPAIVLLHGARRTGRSMIDIWRATADRHGAILVAPDSLGLTWRPSDDDPAFFLSVLQDANAKAPIDGSRVYLFGHSAGAILATLYANRVPMRWRGVATHAGVLDGSSVAAADVAPPMRHYLGTQDHLFPRQAAEETATALAEAGHQVELVLIEGHTHWYYVIGPYLSEEIWRYWQGLG